MAAMALMENLAYLGAREFLESEVLLGLTVSQVVVAKLEKVELTVLSSKEMSASQDFQEGM